eukprot:4104810-Prymnesium_polylepis.1
MPPRRFSCRSITQRRWLGRRYFARSFAAWGRCRLEQCPAARARSTRPVSCSARAAGVACGSMTRS